jgi:hypothetical protein
MKKIRTIFILLAVELCAAYLLANATHYSNNVCSPNNNWHWYDSQNDATSPSVVNCPLIVVQQSAPISGASIYEHHALQILAVMLPLTLAIGLIESFRSKK